MANRHLLRSIAMQVLFEWDFNHLPESAIGDLIERDIKEFAPGMEDRQFLEKLVMGVLKKRKKLDSMIEKTAPEWPIDQIALIDRNVLRVGLYELVFGNPKEVPPKVAINESIELAKTFGGETSGKFVNGVLGTVFREMPGLQQSEEELANGNTRIDQLENLGGAVVYQKKDGQFFFALVHDVFGYWTLSKGRLEEGEDLKTGTAREMKEELGIEVEIEDELGENEYIASHPEKGQVKKHVVYFLARAKSENLILENSGGLDKAAWFAEKDLLELKIYDDLKPILLKAVKKLKF